MQASRLASVDWMRGFVMVLMAVDHASVFFNAGRVAGDSAYLLDSPLVTHRPDEVLPPAQFFTRWITHLCAPTFLFLSGTSLALSVRRRREAGAGEAEIDRHLLARGAVLLALEAGWLSLGPSLAVGRYVLVLQVLYAIGASLILMVPLRRLGAAALAGVALAWMVAGELATLRLAPSAAGSAGVLVGLTLAPAAWGRVVVAYPVLPWLAMMALGWALGERLATTRGALPVRGLALAGAAALALFAFVRGANAYGNMDLLRADTGWVQWLHVSKYPPSLAFSALELGLMALGLAACMAWERRSVAPPRRGNPLLVLGQTALFFYLLHMPLLAVVAVATGRLQSGGLLEAWLAAAAVVALLYPACLAYRRYKAAHPRGWPQYI